MSQTIMFPSFVTGEWTAISSRVLLLGIIILAVGLRVALLTVDLPYISHWDEATNMTISRDVFVSDNLNPEFFNYPSLSIYIHAAGYLPVYLAGDFETPADIPELINQVGGINYAPLMSVFIVGRLIAIAASVIALYLIFICGRHLTGADGGGLLAALFFAVSPNVVQFSDWANPNIYAIAFSLLALWAAYQIYRDGRPRYYIIAGLAAGFAASSKYNAALTTLMIAAAHFLRPDVGLVRSIFSRGIWIAAACSIVAFLIGTPYALLDYDAFIDGVEREAEHYSTGHAGWDSTAFYFTYPLQTQPVATILALLAIGYGAFRRDRMLLVTIAFPIVYFVFINRFIVQNAQTFLLIEPFLFLLAAWSFWHGLRLIHEGSRIPYVAFALVVLVAVGWPLRLTINDLRAEYIREQDRVAVRDWIDEHAEPGDNIFVQSYGPYIDPDVYEVFTSDYKPVHHLYFELKRIDYAIFASRSFHRYYEEPDRYAEEVAMYDRLFETYELAAQFVGPESEFRIYHGDRIDVAATDDS